MIEKPMFATPAVEYRRCRDGSQLLRSRVAATRPSPTILHWLARWAQASPEAALLTVAGAGGQRIPFTYGEAWSEVSRLSAGLRAAGLRRGDRVLVLAPNSIEHLTVGLATMLAGGIYAPVSHQYAAGDGANPRLTHVDGLLEPALTFVAGDDQARVVNASSHGRRVVVGTPGLAELTAADATTGPQPDGLDPSAPSKILLTSGSTGAPKPVAYSQAMMTTNLQITVDVWPFVGDHTPVLVDWLPWSHAFGGNANLNLVLSQGGTLHVDEGGGRPQGLVLTLANLRRLRPTFHGTVPAGWAALLPAIEGDAGFAEAFFGQLDVMFSAGAAMHPSVHRRLSHASETVRGTAVPIVTGWGSTEVGPGATMVHVREADPSSIGTPLPGVEIRLEPVADKLELCVRGPSVAAGYWGLPAESAAAFTPEGFYRTGDAGALLDPERPERGLRFDGRIADDFKLANGSWVDATGLRKALLAASGGAIRDALVIGADRPHLVVLAWADAGSPEFDDAALRRLLAFHNETHGRSTTRLVAGAVLDPEPEGDEVSAKGQLVRGAVLRRRADMIASLYVIAREA